MVYKVFCNRCKKEVPVICANCETPLLKEKRCLNCGSFKIQCSICGAQLKR